MLRDALSRMQRWTNSAATAVDASRSGLGRARGEEQLARLVLEPVAGEVQQHDVVGARLREEVVDARLDLVGLLVPGHLDLEGGHRGIAQHGGECFGVRCWRAQPAQAGVARTRRRRRRGPGAGRSRQVPEACRLTNSSMSRSCWSADACDSSSASPSSSRRTVRNGAW